MTLEKRLAGILVFCVDGLNGFKEEYDLYIPLQRYNVYNSSVESKQKYIPKT